MRESESRLKTVFIFQKVKVKERNKISKSESERGNIKVGARGG